jgi:hypothetical protein
MNRNKKMKKIIRANSGHTLYVKSILFGNLPKKIQNMAKRYTDFYVVKNWDNEGIIFMYLGKGCSDAPKEIVVWYHNGGFWNGYGTNIKDAINGAQSDGWMYA